MQDALRNQQDPQQALASSVWQFVGHILADTPDCPDALRKSVHALMGAPPPEGPAGSPVGQAVQQQARTAAALEQVSMAVEQRQARMAAPEQNRSSNSVLTESVEEETERKVASHMAALVRMRPSMQPGSLEYTQIAGILRELAMEAAVERAGRNADMREACKVFYKKESFEALLAIGLAVQTQKIDGLARFHAASLRSRNAPASVASAMPLKQPITSPVRRKQAQQTKAEKIAYTQSQTISDQLNMPCTQQAPDAAVPAAISDGMITVYPGHNGEPFWTEWKGK